MRPQLAVTANVLPLVLVFTLTMLALSAARAPSGPAPASSGWQQLAQALQLSESPPP